MRRLQVEMQNINEWQFYQWTLNQLISRIVVFCCTLFCIVICLRENAFRSHRCPKFSLRRLYILSPTQIERSFVVNPTSSSRKPVLNCRLSPPIFPLFPSLFFLFPFHPSPFFRRRRSFRFAAESNPSIVKSFEACFISKLHTVQLLSVFIANRVVVQFLFHRSRFFLVAFFANCPFKRACRHYWSKRKKMGKCSCRFQLIFRGNWNKRFLYSHSLLCRSFLSMFRMHCFFYRCTLQLGKTFIFHGKIVNSTF